MYFDQIPMVEWDVRNSGQFKGNAIRSGSYGEQPQEGANTHDKVACSSCLCGFPPVLPTPLQSVQTHWWLVNWDWMRVHGHFVFLYGHNSNSSSFWTRLTQVSFPPGTPNNHQVPAGTTTGTTGNHQELPGNNRKQQVQLGTTRNNKV